MENLLRLHGYDANISRIASELYNSPQKEKIEDAYKATKKLMNSLNIESQNRADKIELARERVRTGFYNNKEVLAKIANEILKEFELE